MEEFYALCRSGNLDSLRKLQSEKKYKHDYMRKLREDDDTEAEILHTVSAIGNAMLGGHYDVGKWLLNIFTYDDYLGNKQIDLRTYIFPPFCQTDNLKTLQWMWDNYLHDLLNLVNDVKISTECLMYACIYGNIDVVKWLILETTMYTRANVESLFDFDKGAFKKEPWIIEKIYPNRDIDSPKRKAIYAWLKWWSRPQSLVRDFTDAIIVTS